MENGTHVNSMDVLCYYVKHVKLYTVEKISCDYFLIWLLERSLIETVLLSTHNNCFVGDVWKKILLRIHVVPMIGNDI